MDKTLFLNSAYIQTAHYLMHFLKKSILQSRCHVQEGPNSFFFQININKTSKKNLKNCFLPQLKISAFVTQIMWMVAKEVFMCTSAKATALAWATDGRGFRWTCLV